MSLTAEAPPNEAGDDRERQAEIQRLREMYNADLDIDLYVSDAKEPEIEEQAAPGEFAVHYGRKLGAPTLRRAGVMIAQKPIILKA